MSAGLKIIRKILLAISFLAIGLATLDLALSLLNGSNRPLWWSIRAYGFALALPLIGIWLAGRISKNDFLVTNLQKGLFRALATFTCLALLHQLVEGITSITDGNGSIIQEMRFILTNSLFVAALAACSLWPTGAQTVETMDEVFE